MRVYQGIKRAVITGVGGQDGILSSQLLIYRGYEVIGFTREISREVADFGQLHKNFKIVQCNGSYFNELKRTIQEFKPNLILHWAAPQPKQVSQDEGRAIDFAELSLKAIYEAAAIIKSVDGYIKVLVPGTSEFFAKDGLPKTVFSEVIGKTPYARNKLLFRKLARELASKYQIDTLFPIFYSHDSPLRNRTYLSKQIYYFMQRQKKENVSFSVGPLSTRRDWSWAPEVVSLVVDELHATEGYREIIVGHGKLTSIVELINLFAVEMHIDDDFWLNISIDNSFVPYEELEGSYADPHYSVLTTLNPVEWVSQYVKTAETLSFNFK